MKSGELVIYVDESGSPDLISTSGQDLLAAGRTPEHLVIAALRVPDPNSLARCVRDCVARANTMRAPGRPDRPELHAARDDPGVRRMVCSELAKLDVKATAIVMNKRLILPGSPWLTDRTVFYNNLLAMLLSDSLHLHERTRVVLSRKNYETETDLDAAVRVIGDRWARFMIGTGAALPVEVTATQERASRRPGLQAVDYVAWAIFQVFERSDVTYYQALQPIIRHVWDLGRLQHYSRKRPIENPP